MSVMYINPFVFAAGGGGGAPGFFTFTIDHTKVGGSNLTDHAIFVAITNAALKTVANGGAVTSSSGHDIRLSSDTAGASLYNWEVVAYDGAAGTFIAEMKLPTVSASVDDVFYMPYGDAAITTFQGNIAGTWDANYKSVHHWGDGTTASFLDSTSNADNGTATGPPTAASGLNGGGAITCNQAISNQWVRGANVQNMSSVTIETWVNYSGTPPASNGSLAGFVSTGGSPADKQVYINTAGKAAFWAYDMSVGPVSLIAPSALSAGWHQIVGTTDGSNIRLYVDGAQVASNTIGATFAGYTNPGFQINGGNSGSITSGQWTTTHGETRLSNVGRAAGHIACNYANRSSPSTFYAIT